MHTGLISVLVGLHGNVYNLNLFSAFSQRNNLVGKRLSVAKPYLNPYWTTDNLGRARWALADSYIKQSSDDTVCKLFSRLSKMNVLCENIRRFSNNVIAFGCGKSTSLNASEKIALESFLNDAVSSTVIIFERALANNCIVHTLDYSTRIKRCNSFFTLFNHTGVYGLHRCVVLPDSSELLFIFQFYGARQLRSFSADVDVNLLRHVSKTQSNVSSHIKYVVCRSSDIRQKCICLRRNNALLFIPLPQFELD